MKKKKTDSLSTKSVKAAPAAAPFAVSTSAAASAPAAKPAQSDKPGPRLAPTAAAKAPKAKEPKKTVSIDFPMEREIVTSSSYTFRITAGPAPERVEVSIDGKEWQACRESVGHWWYDWSGYASGPHTIEARIPSGKRFIKSKPRQFTAI